MNENQKLYAARSIVQYYTQLKMLQPAEQIILDLFQQQWSGMRILDIGVGGGRTTQHFAPLGLHYVGIDYSAAMIAACQNRFAAFPHTTFQACDARDMSQFEDNSFDFILFSFNGIDYVSHADRLNVLREVRRVGKPGGYFFFSSHNLHGIEQQFNWRNQVSLNLITTYVNLMMWVLLRGLNPSINLHYLKTAEYVVVKDESHNFRLKTYYIRPQEQLNQLKFGFNDVRIYSWNSGLELKTEQEWNANGEMWLYYLCTIR